MTSHQSESSATVAPSTLEPERAAPWLTILKTKPCPICGEAHGNGVRAVSSSSVFGPLKCQACGGRFHQASAQTWVLACLFFPSSLLASLVTSLVLLGVPEASTLALKIFAVLTSVVIEVCIVAIYVNRKKPLVPGPRFG